MRTDWLKSFGLPRKAFSKLMLSVNYVIVRLREDDGSSWNACIAALTSASKDDPTGPAGTERVRWFVDLVNNMPAPPTEEGIMPHIVSLRPHQ